MFLRRHGKYLILSLGTCKHLYFIYNFNPFFSNAPFLYPLKTSENHFQGLEKGQFTERKIHDFQFKIKSFEKSIISDVIARVSKLQAFLIRFFITFFVSTQFQIFHQLCIKCCFSVASLYQDKYLL